MLNASDLSILDAVKAPSYSLLLAGLLMDFITFKIETGPMDLHFVFLNLPIFQLFFSIFGHYVNSLDVTHTCLEFNF